MADVDPLGKTVAAEQEAGSSGSAAPIAPGQVLADTYRLERIIGEGGMGVVYQATHLRLGRPFAVKFISGDASDPGVQERFRREAEITSRLKHPHIVDVIDYNHNTKTRPYLVMELLEGEDLANRLTRVGPYQDVKKASVVLSQLCAALDAAHAMRIVHRDLKPRNIFLCQGANGAPWVKVLDFGISKVTDASTSLTQSGSIVGSCHYLAPEQVEGSTSAIGQHTDIFALGVILFEMFSGTVPFKASSVPASLYKIVYVDPPALTSLCPRLPTPICHVIHQALEKRPEDRFQTVRDLLNAFNGALSTPVSARIEDNAAQRSPARVRPTVEVSTKGTPRKRFVALGSLTVVAIALAVVFAVGSFPTVDRAMPTQAEPDLNAIAKQGRGASPALTKKIADPGEPSPREGEAPVAEVRDEDNADSPSKAINKTPNRARAESDVTRTVATTRANTVVDEPRTKKRRSRRARRKISRTKRTKTEPEEVVTKTPTSVNQQLPNAPVKEPPQTGLIRLQSVRRNADGSVQPFWATVSIRGKSGVKHLQTPGKLTDLEPGTYVVSAFRKGYRSSTQTVVLKAGEEKEVRITLEPSE